MRHFAYTVTATRKSQPPRYRYSTARYDMFQVIYVSGGELRFKTAGIDTRLGPGDLAILREGSGFELSTGEIGYHGVCFCATGELPSAFQGAAETTRGSVGARALARLMEQHMASPTPEAGAVLEGLGRALAWEAVRAGAEGDRPGGARRPAAEWAGAVRSALDASLYTTLTARRSLRALPLSYRQLSRLFTQQYGVSPKAYQLHARLQEGRRLLECTEMDVTAIAMELGFASSQHFATRFKALTGHTPSACRMAARAYRDSSARSTKASSSSRPA